MQPPSPPQRATYLALSPEPQRGGGEREGGQGVPFDKLSSIKKHRVFRLGAFLCIHGNESVCIAPGCTSLKHSSTLGGGCQPFPASKGICQALAALQIPLTWYNLEPPRRPKARGARAIKGRASPAPCAPRAWRSRRHQLPTPTAPPTRKGGTGGRTGGLKVDRARSWMRLCACPPWLAGRPLPREGARRSPRASARLPRTGACAQPLTRAALSALSPTVRGKTREAATGGAGTPGAHAGMFR